MPFNDIGHIPWPAPSHVRHMCFLATKFLVMRFDRIDTTFLHAQRNTSFAMLGSQPLPPNARCLKIWPMLRQHITVSPFLLLRRRSQAMLKRRSFLATPREQTTKVSMCLVEAVLNVHRLVHISCCFLGSSRHVGLPSPQVPPSMEVYLPVPNLQILPFLSTQLVRLVAVQPEVSVEV